MHKVFLITSQVSLILFLIAGSVVVLGQTAAIVVGDGALMKTFGTSVSDIACVVAGIAGISSFLLRYTRRGGGARQDDE